MSYPKCHMTDAQIDAAVLRNWNREPSTQLTISDVASFLGCHTDRIKDSYRRQGLPILRRPNPYGVIHNKKRKRTGPVIPE